MSTSIIKTFEKLSAFGVVEREKVKNDLKAVRSLVRRGYMKKVYKNGKVFYELSEKALPLLDVRRKILLHMARLRRHLYPHRSHLYQALLKEVRFLDTTKEEVQEFRFLGDWRLNQKPVRSQLMLSQFRFYQQRELE